MTHPIRMCRDCRCALCGVVAWLVFFSSGTSADALRMPQLATEAQTTSSVAAQTNDRANVNASESGARDDSLVPASDSATVLDGQEAKPTDQSDSPQQKVEEKAKKEKRGSIIAAPIPISSPAIGSGVVLAGGYIFPLIKSDKVSQPSVIGGAAVITDNGSRAWGLAGDFYFKQDTFHITTIYFRGNINYDFYGTGTSAGDAGRKLPLKQTGQFFLGDFLYRLKWKFSVGPRFLSGNSTIVVRASGENQPAPPPDIGLETGLTALGFHISRDTRANRFYPTGGTFFDFTSMFFADALGSKYSFQSYRFTFNYYREAIIKGEKDWKDLMHEKVGEIKAQIVVAGGGGVRFKVSKKYNVNLRADIGQGKDGHTFSMGIAEAF